MKITAVRSLALHAKNDRPYACAPVVFAERGAFLVFIETDVGLTGVGECFATGIAFAPALKTIVEAHLAPILLGEDPTRVEHLWQRMYWRCFRHGRKGLVMHAISGVDIALWDLFGKSCGLPIHKLLGSCHERLPAYASGGFYFPGQGAIGLAEECAGYAAKGFRAIKMKVGRHAGIFPDRATASDRFHHSPRAGEMRVASLEEDVERVAAVREAVGPDVGIAVDANNAWDRDTALRFCRLTAGERLLWLEEPVSTDDVAGSVELAAALDVPIAGYETETGLAAWCTLIERRAIDIAQPGIGYVGGFSEMRRIAAVAEAHGIPVSPHSYSGAVVLAASIHAACAMPNATLIEVDQHPNPLLTELLEEPLTVGKDGTIAPPEGPGLGIRLRHDAIERCVA